MRRAIFFTVINLLCLAVGCKSKKYILEIPYTFRYDQETVARALDIDPRENADSTLYEYDDNLTDREIYLKEKYAVLLQTRPEAIKNYKFYDFIDKKIGKFYFSQPDTTGVSMAYFVKDLFNFAFDTKLPAVAVEIFKSPEIELFLGRKYLQEGDLVFFRYHKDTPISDLALYLRNDRIVTNSPREGLIITRFSTDYFQKRYVVSGRLKSQPND